MPARFFLIGFMWTCLLPVLYASAGGFDDEDERGWSVTNTPSGNFVRAVSHGAAIYGHEFGFLLSRPNCERKVIWLSFSSYELDESAQGTVATFELVTPDAKRMIQVPLLAVVQLVPGSKVVRLVLFTNRPFQPGLAEFLRAYEEMEVRYVAPAWLVKAFDFPEDVFDISGFDEAEEAAEEICRAESERRAI